MLVGLLALEPPNIVWINCEDLDETLGCYGDRYATTPHLDALAKDAILYRNAFANAPICAPARNCLITGLYPTSLGGQHLRCEIELPLTVEPFPNHLKRAGYFVTNYAKTDYNLSSASLSLVPPMKARGTAASVTIKQWPILRSGKAIRPRFRNVGIESPPSLEIESPLFWSARAKAVAFPRRVRV